MSSLFCNKDHGQFCVWLRENDLETLAAQLSESRSDLRPCDLEKNVFDDGPSGLKAIIEDEVGATVKLSIIVRLRNKLAEVLNLRLPANSSPNLDAKSKAPSPTLRTADWNEMVEANKAKSSKSNSSLKVSTELKEGSTYTMTENKTTHGLWFSGNPDRACNLMGVKLVSLTVVKSSRGQNLNGFVVRFSGAILASIVHKKQSSNKAYVAVAGKIVDSPTVYGLVGVAYTADKSVDLMKKLQSVNQELTIYSHVNKKALDQYVNF